MKPIKKHEISVEKAPITVSAFLTKEMVKDIIKKTSVSKLDLILIPGFVQWDTSDLEKTFSLNIKKGPEFASDLPNILNKIENIKLSNKIPANKLIQISGEQLYSDLVKERMNVATNRLNSNTFYINDKKANLAIGHGLPPLIIAEIVNSTEKSDKNIIKKVEHYIASGADVIDIGCVVNKPNPIRVQQIVQLIKNRFNTYISVDSMNPEEILAAINEEIDIILSLDFGNYNDLINIPKNIPIVILPTNVKEGYFPKDPETRVNNLFKLTKIMKDFGFQKLIADPLLETPINPGICNSLETYFLYKRKVSETENKNYELPLFFGISNVVELMDIDSVGINGLLASIAIELDAGILFTVEHSIKLMGGVRELKESVKLNYLAKCKKSPPINQGIQVFQAKGKTNQIIPKIEDKNIISVNELNYDYISDKSGYFKFYVDFYAQKIYTLFFSIDHKLIQTIIGTSAEALSKKIIELKLTSNLQHINYIGRELSKAESCLITGKPYIQD